MKTEEAITTIMRHRTDANIEDREEKFADQTDSK